MKNVVVVGSLNMDLVVQAERLPKQGETILGQSFARIKGGKGANQAVAAARLGASVSMIGVVGKDVFGQELRSSLQEEGIRTKGVLETEEQATGVAQITLAEHDNSIIVVSGANQSCTPAWVQENRDILSKADILLLQLEIPLETVGAAISLAHQNNIPVIFNPAPAQSLPKEWLQNVTVLTPNETELVSLTNASKPEIPAERLMDSIFQTGVPHVVVTRGEEGVLYAEKREEKMETKAYGSIPVKVVDTTGAGDAFNAGLAVALAEEKNMEEAIQFASAAAALAVTRYGAQPSMPTREEVEKLLDRGGAK